MLFWLLLSSCSTPEICDDMCKVAADMQESCISEWTAQWTDIGYTGKSDYKHACETWAWEMHLLEGDAQKAGNQSASDATEEICLERLEWLQSESLDCDAWQSIDWNGTPWNQ